MASKSNSSGTAVSSAPLSHFNDQGIRERWPVIVYRLQSHRGWEVYSDPDAEAMTTTSTLSGNKGSNKSAKGGNAININSSGGNDKPSKVPREVEELTVAPRARCIEVRKMRLRIQLFQQHTPWNPNLPPPQHSSSNRTSRAGKVSQQNVKHGQENGSNVVGADKYVNNDDKQYDLDTPGPDGWNDNSLLVRRRNTLLVTTRRGMGAVVFRFKSSRDCIDFCDRLVYLNREYLTRPPPPPCDGAEDTTSQKRNRSTEDNDGYVKNGMDKRECFLDEMKGIKRRKGAIFGDTDASAPFFDKSLRCQMQTMEENSGHDIGDEASGLSHSIKQSTRQEEMMNYIVQLAHSEEFRGFVDELERGLELAPDTAAIHAALGV